MIRFMLLGIVAIAMGVIAPFVGASRSVSIAPNATFSWLLARPIIPELPEETGSGSESNQQEERRDRRNEEERRQDDENRWDENGWDDEEFERRQDEARDFFEDIF